MQTEAKIKAIKALETKFANIAPSIEYSNFDCGNRIEAIMSPVYLGIWLYQSATETRFVLEVDMLKDATIWLEDGVTRDVNVIAVQFETFADALAAFNMVATELSKEDGFNHI